MRRVLMLGCLMVFGVASISIVSARQNEMVVEVEQVHDNLFILRGGGGHSAAFVTSDGVVLVDTKIAGWGQPLIDAVGELTSNPITTIINTHAHFDPVSGNVEFPASVEYARTLRLAHATLTEVDTVITGHSTLMTRADIAEMADFVDTFVSGVRAGKIQGRSAGDIAATWLPPARFRTAYSVPGADRLEAYVQVVFDELDGQ